MAKIFWIAEKDGDTMEMFAFNNKRKAQEKAMELAPHFSFGDTEIPKEEDDDSGDQWLYSGTINAKACFVLYREGGMPNVDGNFVDVATREGFKIAHDISVYSFTALAQRAKKLMLNRNAALLTLSYLGSQRTLPNYNVMGIAKAALESSTRYLANSMGVDQIRVNAISAGPVKTLAASGVKSFKKMLSYNASRAPLKRNITTEEVGNAAAFLCSDLASGITGEILYVDAGFNITAMGDLSEVN